VPFENVIHPAFSPHSRPSKYPVAGAGTATVHDVLRGRLSRLLVGGPLESCIPTDAGGITATDVTVPTAGSGFYYLVRGRNACGTGTYGATSAGAPRISNVCP